MAADTRTGACFAEVSSSLLAAGAFSMGKLFSDDNGADGDGKILESLQRTSLENRIADLREQLASVPEQAGYILCTVQWLCALTEKAEISRP